MLLVCCGPWCWNSMREKAIDERPRLFPGRDRFAFPTLLSLASNAAWCVQLLILRYPGWFPLLFGADAGVFWWFPVKLWWLCWWSRWHPRLQSQRMFQSWGWWVGWERSCCILYPKPRSWVLMLSFGNEEMIRHWYGIGVGTRGRVTASVLMSVKSCLHRPGWLGPMILIERRYDHWKPREQNFSIQSAAIAKGTGQAIGHDWAAITSRSWPLAIKSALSRKWVQNGKTIVGKNGHFQTTTTTATATTTTFIGWANCHNVECCSFSFTSAKVARPP